MFTPRTAGWARDVPSRTQMLPPPRAEDELSATTAAERAEAHNACANALITDGLLRDAVLAYTRAINAINVAGGLARLGTYYANRSQARLKLEEYELAVHDAAFALSLDPTLWKARLRLMRALEAIGRSASASDAARALLAASPPAAAAQEASAVLRRQPARSDPAPRTIVLSPTMRLRLHVGGPALSGLRPALTRTPRGLRTVRAGYACQLSASCTYLRRRAACLQGATYCAYGVRVLARTCRGRTA